MSMQRIQKLPRNVASRSKMVSQEVCSTSHMLNTNARSPNSYSQQTAIFGFENQQLTDIIRTRHPFILEIDKHEK